MISTVVGQGVASVSLGSPTGVAVDAAGNLYVADGANCVVWKVPLGQPAQVFAGQLGNCASPLVPSPTANLPLPNATQTTLNYPLDVAVCGNSVFIADVPTNTGVNFPQFGVHKIDISTTPNTFVFVPNVFPLAVTDSIYYNPPSNPTPGPVTLSTTFVHPQAITCDGAGDLFVQSYYVRVDGSQIWSLDALSAGGIASNIFAQFDTMVQGVAVDAYNHVYTVAGPITGSAGTGVSPQGGMSILAITLNSASNLSTASFGYLATDRTLWTAAGTIPDPNQNPATTQVQLPVNSMRLAIDGGCHFFVDESSQSPLTPAYYVTEVAPPANGPLPDRKNCAGSSYASTYVAGNGTPGYNSDGIAAATAELNGPQGLTIDNSGHLFIADDLNGRVRELSQLGAGALALTLSPPLSVGSYIGYQQSLTLGPSYFYVAGGSTVNWLGPQLDVLSTSTAYGLPVPYLGILASAPIGKQVAGAGSPITMIADQFRGLVYVSNTADGNLYVIDGGTLGVLGQVALQNPSASLLAIDTALNRIYVGGSNSTAVSVVSGYVHATSTTPAVAPMLIANVGFPAVFIDSLAVDPHTHLVYAVCNACTGTGSEQGLITIDPTQAPPVASSEVFPTVEAVYASDFIGPSLVVDPATGAPIVAGATVALPGSSQLYAVQAFDPGLQSYRSVSFPWAPLTVSLDAVSRNLFVTDGDGVPSDPSSNVAMVQNLDALPTLQIPNPVLTATPVPIGYPIAAPTAHVFDAQPDPAAGQLYVSAVSQSLTSPSAVARQGIVEVWDSLNANNVSSQQRNASVTVPNGGGGYLSVGTASFVYLADQINNVVYAINDYPFTPVPQPTMTPPGGALPVGGSVTLTAVTPGDTIIYTLDGTSPVYGNPIPCGSPCVVVVSAAANLMAIEVSTSGVPSFVVSGLFTVQQPTTVGVALSQASVTGGIPVAATATIKPATTGASVGGTVTFSASAGGTTSTLCNAMPVSADQASCAFNEAGAGTYTITATYSGDATNAGGSASQTLTVTAAGTSVNPVAVTYTPGLNPIALTGGASGSTPTYVLNDDTSVGVLLNGALVAGAGCPALTGSISTSSIASFAGDHATAGVISFDASSSRLYMVLTLSTAANLAQGTVLTYETIASGGCSVGPTVQVVSAGLASIELNVDPVQGNVYLLSATSGLLPDTLFVLAINSLASYPSAAPASLPQTSLDYSATYGPILVDTFDHRVYINDLGTAAQNAPAGLNASPGFFVYDPGHGTTVAGNLQYVLGYRDSSGVTVPINASALLVDGKGRLVIVSQNPVSFTATNPLPVLVTPITVLDATQFSYFTGAVAAGGLPGGHQGYDIVAGAGVSTIASTAGFNAISAAGIDTTNGIVYAYAYGASVANFIVTATQSSGSLYAFNLATGTAVQYASAQPLANLYLRTAPWAQMTFNPVSDNVVSYASNALGVSGPLCNGAPLTLQQVAGGGSTLVSTLLAPTLDAGDGYTYFLLQTPGSLATNFIAQHSIEAVPAIGVCTIASPIVVLPANTQLPAATAGTVYAPVGAFSATGGTPPYTWNAGAGLPPGVTLSAAGALSGPPGQVGNYTFRISATDAKGNSGTQTYTVSVVCGAVPSLGPIDFVVQAGTAFSQQLSATGGAAPLTFTAPVLGDGLMLSSTGLLAGTPAAAGTAQVPVAVTLPLPVTVTDAYGCSASATGSVVVMPPQVATVSVSPASAVPGQTLTSVTVTGSNFTTSTAFSFGAGITVSNVAVTGSTTATMTLAVALNAPVGPRGLTVTTGTSGQSFAGVFQVLAYLPTIQTITPSSGYPGQTLTITVTGTNLVDPTGANTLPVFNFGWAPSVTAQSVSGPANGTQTAVVQLTIPPSLAPSANYPVSVNTGFVPGTGTQVFQGGQGLSSTPFTVTAGVTVPAAPAIGTAVAGNAQALVAFTAPTVTGGTPITSYTATSNPGGLTASGAASPITVSGLTNGTPYTFTVVATNSAGNGPPSAASNSVTPGVAPAFTSAAAATFVDVSAGSFTITTSGSPTPTLAETGALPPGLSFNSTTGVLSGTPASSAAGNYTLSFTATNGIGTPATQIFTLTVDNTPAGTNVAVTPVDPSTGAVPASLTFGSVTVAGMTTVSSSSTGTAPPSGFAVGTPAVYYNLATTATYSGAIIVCINYAGVTFTTTPPQLFHYTGGAWVNVTTSVNTATQTVCGSVNSLSPFAIFQPVILNQAISFGAAPSITVGGSGALSATGGASGNPIVFSSTSPAVCSVSASTVFGLAVGTCTIAANQAGNANYAAAPQVLLSFPIGGAAANVRISPATLAFGNQVVGVASRALTLRLSNPGKVSLSIGGLVFSDPQYAQATGKDAGSCGATLASGSSCTIGVEFTPGAPGMAAATLTFEGGTMVPAAPVALSGTGVAAAQTVAWSPSPYNFGSVRIGAGASSACQDAVPCQKFTLTNTGNVTMTGLGQAALAGDAAFSVVRQLSNCGPSGNGQASGVMQLAPGAHCQVVVQFRALAPAAVRAATLSVTDSFGGQSVGISGTGSVN